MSESKSTRSRCRSAASSRPRAGWRPVAAALVALGLTAAACGSDSDSGSTIPTTTTPSATVAPATTLPTSATTTAATTVPPAAATTTTEPSSEACPSFIDKPDLPLKICDKGDKVTEVQEGLVDAGYEIVVDGFFGNQTKFAVQQFQAANGLEVDGIVGPITFGKLFPT